MCIRDSNTAEEVLQTDYFNQNQVALIKAVAVSYTHLDVYKRQVITVGELAKELAKGADGKAFDTIEDAKPEILKTIKSGDVVLVKASHSMQFENIVEFLKQNF